MFLPGSDIKLGTRNLVASSLLTNLISYWKLDEFSDASGPVTRVDSMNGNALTDNNTVASGTGIISNAASFVAANGEFLSRADNSSLNPSTASWVFWVNHVDTVGVQSYFSKDPGSSPNRSWYCFNNGGTMAFEAWDANSVNTQTVNLAGPSVGVWTMITCIADGALLKISKNAGAFTTAAFAFTLNTASTFAFEIGRAQQNATRCMNGLIDEFGFWNAPLTQAQVTSLYNGGIGRTHPFIGAS